MKGQDITQEQKRRLSLEETYSLVNQLVDKLREHHFDLILVIARGGLVLGGYVSKKLGIFDVQLLAITGYRQGRKLDKPIITQRPAEQDLHGKNVLIVDDIIQSGDTAHLATTIVTNAGGRPTLAVLHNKPHLCRPDVAPDFYIANIDYWAVYDWESDGEREQ